MPIRSQTTLKQAEEAFNRGELEQAKVLALIGIGWMLDDLTCYFPELYDTYTQIEIHEPQEQDEAMPTRQILKSFDVEHPE